MNPTTKYIVIDAQKVLTVPHQVDQVATAPNDKFLLAYHSQETTVSLFATDHSRKDIELSSPTGSLCMCISSDGKHLAYASEGSSELLVHNLATGREAAVLHDSDVVDARFDGKGRLWSARREEDGFVVEVRHPLSWEFLSATQVSDSYFAEGGAEIRYGSDEDSMYVAAYSGQSEQENYACTLHEDRVEAKHVAEMGGQQFVFACSHGRTLTLDHMNCEIACFSGEGHCASRIGWPDYAEDETEDERPGYFGCQLDEIHFLAASQEGRLFIVRLDDLQILSEIAVKGFEPVALSAKYRSLSDIQGSGSDLRFIGRCGGYVYTFFADDHHSCSHQIAILAVAELLRATGKGE